MARLIVNPGSPTAWEIELKPGTNTLGRGFANDFKIADPSVSGSHCQITVDNSSVFIRDLGSTNGTYVNRAPVKEAALQPGQTIHLGGVEMMFQGDPQPYVRVTDTAPAPAEEPALAVPPPLEPSHDAPLAPPLTATGTHSCKFHPKTAARYFCNKCNLAFCELCITTRPVGGAARKFCRKCGSECTPLRVQAQRGGTAPSFYRRLPGAFIYPARGSGVFFLVLCTVVLFGLGFISKGLLSIFTKMVFFGYLFSFMQTIIHSTAAGDEEMPGLPPFDGLFGAFFRLAGAALMSFGVAFGLFLVAFFNEESQAGSTYMIPALVLGCLYFPMALLAVAMKDTPLASNPLIVVPAIFKAPLEYLLTVIVLAAVMGLRSLGGPLIDSVFPRGLTTHSMAKLFGYLGSWAVWNFAEVYLLAVNMRILGLLYVSKKQKLAWFDH
jgi:FHA domain-containing protein